MACYAARALVEICLNGELPAPAAQRLLVRAPFLTDRLWPSRPFVRTARCAARSRAAGPRRRALLRACDASAWCEAVRVLSLFSARETARDRFGEGALRRLPVLPRFKSLWARLRTSDDALRPFGGGNFIPARRAFDNPMAMACCGDLAPCFPSRTCSISSRTNSPACVEGDFPSRLSSRALSRVS